MWDRGERKEAQILKAGQVDGTESWNPETEPPLTPDKPWGAGSSRGATQMWWEGNLLPSRCASKTPQQMRAGATATPGLTLTLEARLLTSKQLSTHFASACCVQGLCSAAHWAVGQTVQLYSFQNGFACPIVSGSHRSPD